MRSGYTKVKHNQKQYVLRNNVILEKLAKFTCEKVFRRKTGTDEVPLLKRVNLSMEKNSFPTDDREII